MFSENNSKVILLSLSFLILGCLPKTEILEFHNLSIDNSIKNEFRLSLVSDSIYRVILNTGENHSVAQIDKIDVFDNLIFILDKEILETLFIFDFEGKFIKKLEVGLGGPGEFTSIEDFTLGLDGNIYILNNDRMRVFTYTKEGEYLNEFRIPDFAHSIEYYLNSIFLYRNNSFIKNDPLKNMQIMRLSTSGSILESYLPISTTTNYFSFHESFKPFHKTGNSLMFSQALNDTVYIYESDEFKPFLALDFSTKALRQDKRLISSIQEFSSSPKSKTKEYLMGSILDIKGIYSGLFYSGKSYKYFHFNSRDSSLMVSKRFINDIDDFPILHIKYSTEEYLISDVPYEMLQAFVVTLTDSDPLKERINSLINDADKKGQNSILTFYYFQK